jgi:hypothetical protein
MTTSLVERSSPLTLLGLVITVAAVFVLPVPPVLSIGLATFGFVLTMFEGRSIYSLMAGGLVAWSVFVLLMARAASPDAPNLAEPIPVPSGYGFELDPRSTNREHLYRSRSMPLGRAQSAAIEVVDHYVNALTPAWTVIDREERPDLLMVELREGDSSRGINIFVEVVEPFGRPTFLDLRIQALLCSEDLPGLGPGEVKCMTAPIRNLVRYPGGEPVVPSPQPSPEPLREPVAVPSGYGFSLDTGLSSEDMHAYRSAIMGIPEARRAQRLVLRYYRQELDDWIIVGQDERNLLIKDPDSTDGLAIQADWSVYVGEVSGVVELEIRAISCQEDYSCNWRPPGA